MSNAGEGTEVRYDSGEKSSVAAVGLVIGSWIMRHNADMTGRVHNNNTCAGILFEDES